jgi:drug/metabolite transporter (DMT)-like permease
MGDAPLAICLGLFSAITLAAANMSVKMGSDVLIGRGILSATSAILVFPALFFVPMPDRVTWEALVLALPAHFAYQMCLVRAMQRGELSLVFPIMRGLAPLLTAIVALLLLRELLAPLAWIGLALATLSVIVFALPPRGVRLADHPDRIALMWALATAVAISLYNVADARGVRLAPEPFTFIVWLFLLDPIGVVTTTLIRRRNALREALAMRWGYGAIAGALSVLSFGSALYAFSLIETAKVSALRETSVVFAAAMGSFYLGDSFGRRRIVAALTLAAGLILMEFG